ncbi:MAG: hypothetical protein WKG52_11610 [Variovorax sp.]
MSNKKLTSAERRRFVLLGLAVFSSVPAMPAHAGLPASYDAMRVTAPFSFGERVFDLTAALKTGRESGKPVFVYLGASNCPPCDDYVSFLRKNEGELLPLFHRVVAVEIKTSLRGPDIWIVLDGKRYSLAEFKASIGDKNAGISYPTFWLLGANGKQVRQLPRGVSRYTSVESLSGLLDPKIVD